MQESQKNNESNKAKTKRLSDQTYHLLIKLTTVQTQAHLSTDDIIKAHNAIVNRKGTVWFGKSGRPLRKSNINLFRLSIKENKSSRLILVRGTGSEREYFEARMYAVETAEFCPLSEHVPEYYRDVINHMSMWIEIGSLGKLQKNKLNKLIVASSQRPIVEVVPRCQQPSMIVCEKQ